MKAKRKNKLIIGVILTIVIGGVLTYQLAYSKYRVNRNVNLATGTIKNTLSDFQMAVKISDDKVNYNDTNSVPASGYALNTSKSTCKVSDTVDSSVTIEYNNGKINFLGATKKGTKCYLYFDKDTGILATSVSDLTTKLSSIAKTTTPVFSSIATTDEGVYSVSDGMYGGTSYYWRGAVTNNYVKFGDYCWRIIRINGDKTMRLIYDGTTCHANGTSTAESIAVASTAYNPSYDQSYYVGWTYSSAQRPSTDVPQTSGTASNAKTQLESWYSSKITGTNVNKVADGKFCNDRNVTAAPSGWSGYVTTWSANGKQFAYAGPKRLYQSYSPTLSCPNGDIYQLKVGLITADEVEFAGGKNKNNSSYYLYNGQYYWAMSPSNWSSSGHALVNYVSSSGLLTHGSVDSTNGLRPVINLNADTTFASSGTGTQSNPYVVQ